MQLFAFDPFLLLKEFKQGVLPKYSILYFKFLKLNVNFHTVSMFVIAELGKSNLHKTSKYL